MTSQDVEFAQGKSNPKGEDASPTPCSTDPFFGFFRDVASSRLRGVQITDPFVGPVGAFYATVAGQSVADCDWYLQHAGTAPGSVLDLCCGGGRATVHLAKAGWTVHGLDLSSDMIAVAKRSVLRLAPDVSDRCRLTVGDAFQIEPASYDCVILGGLTLTLFDNVGQRSAMLAAAARSLRPGGRFLLDYSPVLPGESQSDVVRTFTYALNGSAPGFAIVGNRRQPNRSRQATNVMLELDSRDGGAPRRYLAGFGYQIIDPEELRSMAMGHGLYYLGHDDAVGMPDGVDAPPYRLESFERR